MSLKENIEMVKEELTSEEKFFEKAVVTEKFVKKYKNLMIAGVVAIVIFVAANIVYTINKQNTITSANQTLMELQKNPSDQVILARLKSLSPALADVWSYSQAIVNKDIEALKTLESSKTILVNDLASYGVADDLNDASKLQDYASKQSSIYKDLAIIQNAVILINSSKLDEARSKLSMINVDSPLAQVAKALMHYGVK